MTTQNVIESLALWFAADNSKNPERFCEDAAIMFDMDELEVFHIIHPYIDRVVYGGDEYFEWKPLEEFLRIQRTKEAV